MRFRHNFFTSTEGFFYPTNSNHNTGTKRHISYILPLKIVAWLTMIRQHQVSNKLAQNFLFSRSTVYFMQLSFSNWSWIRKFLPNNYTFNRLDRPNFHSSWHNICSHHNRKDCLDFLDSVKTVQHESLNESKDMPSSRLISATVADQWFLRLGRQTGSFDGSGRWYRWYRFAFPWNHLQCISG